MMNLEDIKEFIQASYKNHDIEYEFDKKCHSYIEISLDEGKPLLLNQVINSMVKVTIHNVGTAYFPIDPYRKDLSWNEVRDLVNSL